MVSAGKSLLGGIILGIVIVIALETLIALAFLSSQGVKNPFSFVKSVLGSIPQLSSINLTAIKEINLTSLKNLKNLVNLTKSSQQEAYVNITNISVVAKTNVSESQQNTSMLGLLTYKQVSKGFSVQAGSVVNYTFSLPDYIKLPMSVSSIKAFPSGFEVAYVIPKLPYSIEPGGQANFTVIIKVPDASYTGQLQINVSVSAS